MTQSKTGRALAILLLGVAFGIYRHVDEMRWIGRGRDAFLASQGQHFDKIAQYHPLGTMLIAGIILIGMALGLYELVAAAIAKILPPSTVEE